jgi:hypothetical protein
VERVCSNEVPLPLWLGKLIQYFIEQVRFHLKPKENVLSIWINKKGAPLGMYIFIN